MGVKSGPPGPIPKAPPRPGSDFDLSSVQPPANASATADIRKGRTTMNGFMPKVQFSLAGLSVGFAVLSVDSVGWGWSLYFMLVALMCVVIGVAKSQDTD